MYKKWRESYKPYNNCLGSTELNMQEAFAGGFDAYLNEKDSLLENIKKLEESNELLRKELDYYQRQVAIKC